MSDKKVVEQKVPVTIETTQTVKDRLKNIATVMGLTRNVKGEPVGNITLLLNLFIRFIFEHKDEFVAWHTAKVDEAISSE